MHAVINADFAFDQSEFCYKRFRRRQHGLFVAKSAEPTDIICVKKLFDGIVVDCGDLAKQNETKVSVLSQSISLMRKTYP